MPKYIPTNDDLLIDDRLPKNVCSNCGDPIESFMQFCGSGCRHQYEAWEDFCMEDFWGQQARDEMDDWVG